ncbi:hypothetical protein [Cohnella sp. GCM10027633]|uniref:hypothetical protein n=1 Tax=unclassified Cohnella TaxID=2636738 RepID=UPI00363B35C1
MSSTKRKKSIDRTSSANEEFAFWTDFQRQIGTYLYGRRMYESMAYGETASAASEAASFIFTTA